MRPILLRGCRVVDARGLQAERADILIEDERIAAVEPGALPFDAPRLAGAQVLELEGLTGTVVRMARDYGVAAPVTNAVYALLRPAALRIEAARSHAPGVGS